MLSVRKWLDENRDRPASLAGAVENDTTDLCQTVREHARAGHLDAIDEAHLDQCSDCRQAIGEVH